MFAKIENGAVVKYPYTYTDLQMDNPNVSFVADEQYNILIFSNETELNAFNVYSVRATTQPQYNPLNHVNEGTPVNIDGVWTQVWEETPLTEQEINDTKLAIIKQIKDKADHLTQNGGYPVPVDGVAKWFHSDTISRTQQIGLFLMGTDIPPGLEWKTMDGSFVPMTQQLAQAIFSAATQQDIAIFNHSQQLQTAVLSAVNPFVIDIDTGWPVTFLS